MTTAPFLEHDNVSFSKILLSKEVAGIIKQAVREATGMVHQPCNDEKNFKEENVYDVMKSKCSSNCWCKKGKFDKYIYS